MPICITSVCAMGSLQEQVDDLLRAPVAQNQRIQNVFGEKEIELKIYAILNRKALIHNTWYQKNDKIGGFTIAHISEKEVKLIDKKGVSKTLTLQKRIFE